MLTTGNLATIFEVSSQTVINWCDKKMIEFTRISPSGPRRFSEKALSDFLTQQGYLLKHLSPEDRAKYGMDEISESELHKKINNYIKENLKIEIITCNDEIQVGLIIAGERFSIDHQ